MEKEYWMCIIGDTTRGELPHGADLPMRNAVEDAFKTTVGYEPEICWSGWGNTKEKVDMINYVWSMSEDNPLYDKILSARRKVEKTWKELNLED